MFGPRLTNDSVRIALLLYLLATGREITAGRRDRISRFAWLGGALFFLAHVAAAFYFHHDMSHRAAFENTAKRTEEMLGFAFGSGIYFSYAFTLLWISDALWRCFGQASYASRSTWLHLSVHTYMFFIALNGAAVFEGGVTRWGGLLGTMLLVGLLVKRLRNQRRSAPSSEAATS